MRCSALVAVLLPAVLACENAKTHSCGAAFVASSAEAASFCHTYTASVVTATTDVPAAFNSACSGMAKSLSKACTCYVAASASVVEATSSAAPYPVAANVTTTSMAYATSYPTAVSSFITSIKASSSAQTAAVSIASQAVATVAASMNKSYNAASSGAEAGVGGTALTSLAGGSGVGGTTCTVTAASDVTASAAACSNILLSDVSIPASEGMTVTVPSDGALIFAGTMTVEYTPDSSYTPIVIKGTNAKVVGLAGAVIDGQGAQYWDGEGSNGGIDKPDHFIKFGDMESSSFSEITIQNWPTHLFEITGCTDMTISNVILDNSAGDATDSDGDALGHNTDAFDVSSTDGLYISGATVYNQDDCVAVNSGSNMLFENMYCSGGHGLSIGSVKSDVTISNITFQDSSVINSENACRIKTTADDTDSTVSDITYSNIYVENISDYVIDVQQDYENGSPTGDPTTGITVSGVTFSNIQGTCTDDAYQYYILCGSSSSCSNFTYSGLSITGGTTSCSPSGDLCPS